MQYLDPSKTRTVHVRVLINAQVAQTQRINTTILQINGTTQPSSILIRTHFAESSNIIVAAL